MLKILTTSAIIIIVLAGLIASINNWLVIDDLANCSRPTNLPGKCAAADAIIAISGGDTPARTTQAIQLYKDGWAPKIIFSGAALDPKSPSNAQAMRLQALNAGVPDFAILLDENSEDTAKNAINTKALLDRGTDRVILVTSPYHQRRASLEFKRIFGTNITVVNSPTNSDRQWGDPWWLSPNGWWLAISETIKALIVTAK